MLRLSYIITGANTDTLSRNERLVYVCFLFWFCFTMTRGEWSFSDAKSWDFMRAQTRIRSGNVVYIGVAIKYTCSVN